MKTKLSCWVVDDEPMARELIKRYVERTPFMVLRHVMGSALEVMDMLRQEEPPHVIFLDIQMPEFNGLQLSKQLPKETKIVFTTAFDRYAIQGYKVHAFDYLLKPIDYSEFLETANKLAIRFREDRESPRHAAEGLVGTTDFIFVKSEYKQLQVRLLDIVYIEGLKDYVKIYLRDRESPILSLLSMKKLEDELPPGQFMRIHRSFIVALDKIEEVERNQIVIGKQRITVAEQYRIPFREFIQRKQL